MFHIISKLHDIAEKLEEQGKDALAEAIDKIASTIIEAYKPRIKRQRKSRGRTKVRRKQYYKRHKQRIKRKQKRYRKRKRVHIKRRKRLKHYKRFG